jgi:hypothetical protein
MSVPGTTAVLYPATCALPSPMRMICAFSARGEPVGLSRLRVSRDTGGSELPSLSSTGMPSGFAISTDAAIAPCQLLLSTIATACGRFAGDVDGKTALTAPATSATGSAPATRVVLRVAVTGKPSSCAADVSLDCALTSGGWALPRAFACFSFRFLQPDTATSATSSSTASGRGTAAEDIDARGGKRKRVSCDWLTGQSTPPSRVAATRHTT